MKRWMTIALLTTMALSLPALAQGPPPEAGPGAGPPPEIVLKNFLNLSDEQVIALHGLLDTRRQSAEALLPQLDAAQAALQAALSGGNTDPAQIGTLFLAVDGLRKQLDQVDETFRTGFVNILTQAQQAKVQEVRNLEKALKAGEALRHLMGGAPQGGPGPRNIAGSGPSAPPPPALQ